MENLKILEAEFKKGMINKDFKAFKRSHPKLLNVILKSMDKALHKPTVMKWVGVEEDTPNEHEDVLVYYYSNKRSKDFPNLQFIQESSFYDGKFECKEEVTHWAELPNPPVS